MKVKWLGHSSFVLTAANGIRVITDPYKPGAFGLKHNDIQESADIVTVSHHHDDHDGTASVKGTPVIIDKAGEKKVQAIDIKGIQCYHDNESGKQRGNNLAFRFVIDGISVCHLGDLGHQLSPKQLGELGQVDILLVPVGGRFTLDPNGATDLCNKIKPKIVIPMHFKTDKCPFVEYSAKDFTKGKPGVSESGSSEVEYTRETIPSVTEVVVLEYAL